MWEFFLIRLSLFRYRGNRSSIFRNEWVGNFSTGGFPYLGAGVTEVLYFVINGCENFFTGGFPYLGAWATGVLYFVMNGCGNFSIGGLLI